MSFIEFESNSFFFMQTLTGKSVYVHTKFSAENTLSNWPIEKCKERPESNQPRVMFGLFGFGFAIADFSPCLINQGSEFEFITYEFNTQWGY